MKDFAPARVLHVELTQPLQDISSENARADHQYRRAICLVRLHTQPIGLVEVKLNEDRLCSDDLAKEIWRALGSEITAHWSEDGLPPIDTITVAGLPVSDPPKCLQERQAILDDAPFMSVIVATRDRPERLRACLKSLLSLEYPNYEIIVVDNAPSSNTTADLFRQEYSRSARVRYVREDSPGVAIAHNRGLAEVQSTLVAFTDDDVVVDRDWLVELVRGFRGAPKVACVTGMILPAEIETPVQEWVEQSVGFGKGYARRVFDLSENKPKNFLFPYTAGTLGSGANMAFQTDILRALGGFDPALGAGSIALGGDDLAAFFEIIVRGYRLVYQPTAIVHHWHRRDYAGLRRQAYGYGAGLSAYLTKTLIDHPTRLLDFAARIPLGLLYTLGSHSPVNARKPANYPSELTQIERKGMLVGPFRYLQSRWLSRRAKQSAGALIASVPSKPAVDRASRV